MIDAHTHIGRVLHDRKALMPADLLRFMDGHGIEQSVVLPIENPEELDYYVTTDQVLRWCRRYPDRLIPFCNVDPRRGNNDGSWDPGPVIEEYVGRGCRGFGEVLANLRVDDERMQAIYETCGLLGLPVVIHFGGKFGLYDDLGLLRLEQMLKRYPKTVFIGHANYFWTEISGDVTEDTRHSYPDRPVAPGGRLDYLLSTYGNLYGDLSAATGYNAVSRDPKFGRAFLERHSRKLLFGTDYLIPGQPTPIIGYLRNAGLSRRTLRMILSENAKRLLRQI